jgi:hypothetical protein
MGYYLYFYGGNTLFEKECNIIISDAIPRIWVLSSCGWQKKAAKQLKDSTLETSDVGRAVHFGL